MERADVYSIKVCTYVARISQQNYKIIVDMRTEQHDNLEAVRVVLYEKLSDAL